MPDIRTIAAAINAEIIGDPEKEIVEPVGLNNDNARQDVVMWCRSGNESRLKDLKFGNVICEYIDPDHQQPECTYLLVMNARKAFQQVMQQFFRHPLPKGISSTAVIGNDVVLGQDIYIGHHVVIEDNCIIGNNCRIDHNTVIRSRTVLGEHVTIGSNTSVGSDGFGFEKNEESFYEIIPHVGNVVIEDHVEIGDNVVIDKAVMGSTVIGAHSKIDNLSYIAHGVTIGKNCLVIGGAVISGSTHVSDNVWISPNATLMNKIKIGEGSVIGIGSVVLKDVPDKITVAGNPARIINKIKTGK